MGLPVVVRVQQIFCRLALGYWALKLGWNTRSFGGNFATQKKRRKDEAAPAKSNRRLIFVLLCLCVVVAIDFQRAVNTKTQGTQAMQRQFEDSFARSGVQGLVGEVSVAERVRGSERESERE